MPTTPRSGLGATVVFGMRQAPVVAPGRPAFAQKEGLSYGADVVVHRSPAPTLRRHRSTPSAQPGKHRSRRAGLLGRVERST